MEQKTKFVQTKKEFFAHLRLRQEMDKIVGEGLKAQGMSEQGINDYLQMINEDNDD